jgi:uncharacterized membrane protein YcaP (DUF421 family)
VDPLRIAVRCLVAYGLLWMLLRLSGKRTVRQAHPLDFVLALVIGDLVDDAIWSEVPVAQFIVAAATLVWTKVALDTIGSRAGGRP